MRVWTLTDHACLTDVLHPADKPLLRLRGPQRPGGRAVRPPQRNRDSAPSTRGSRSRIAGVRTEIASLETRPQRRGLRGHRAVPPTKVAHRPRGVPFTT